LIKRLNILTVILIVLLTSSMVFAKANHQLAPAEKVTVSGNLVTVPLVVTNEDNLAAMDIPLKFSEGVTLKEVTFEGTRVEYFDMKASVIKNDERTVVLGLVPQISAAHKTDLKAGTGPVANLVFEINDPSVKEITLETVDLKGPDHTLMFVYHEADEMGRPTSVEVLPEFSQVALSLSGSGAGLPESYALSQNYPNPFNPTTEINFDLPVASKVSLVIYNVLGQEVESLVDRNMDAGSHTVSWDASNYSSGVYFYRISAENFTETKKMMMLK
jgi:hypothetical protein